MYKGGQYKYLQPCTHSGSSRNKRGKNGRKRQISLSNANWRGEFWGLFWMHALIVCCGYWREGSSTAWVRSMRMHVDRTSWCGWREPWVCEYQQKILKCEKESRQTVDQQGRMDRNLRRSCDREQRVCSQCVLVQEASEENEGEAWCDRVSLLGILI